MTMTVARRDSRPARSMPFGLSRPAAIAVALTVVALLPVFVVIATRVGRTWVPVGDLALVDLRVRDVWSGDIPLIGTYNRFGWNHPGPAMFWLLASLSGLVGRPAWATLVGGAALQGVAIVALAALAWRKAGLALVAIVLALNGLAYGAFGTVLLLWPWNPSIAYPFFGVLIVMAWSIADGDIRLLPFAVLVGTFLIQTHVGYAPMVLVAIAFAVISALRIAPSWSDRAASWRRPLLWSGAVLALSWAPAVAQELFRRPNVELLGRFLLSSPGESRLGLSAAAGIFGEAFALPPPWLGGRTGLDSFANTVLGVSSAWMLVPVVLLGLAGVAVWRPEGRRLSRLVGLITLLVVTGLWSISRVAGPAERYVFYWRVPLAIATVAVALGACWYGFGADRSVIGRRAAFGGLVAVLVWSSVATGRQVAEAGDVLGAESQAQELLAAIEPTRALDGSVLVRAPDTAFRGLQRAVVNELDRAGIDVRVDSELGFQFGESRVSTANDVDRVLYVVEGGQYLSVLSAEPGAEVLWQAPALAPAEEKELRELQRQVWAELVVAGRPDLFTALGSPIVALGLADVDGVDPVAVERIEVLNQLFAEADECRCAVIAFSAEDAPKFDLPR